MKVSRGIETAVEEGIEEMIFGKYKYRGGVEEQPIRCKNKSPIYPPAVEKLSRKHTRYRDVVKIAKWKKLKKLDRQQGIEEVLS